MGKGSGSGLQSLGSALHARVANAQVAFPHRAHFGVVFNLQGGYLKNLPDLRVGCGLVQCRQERSAQGHQRIFEFVRTVADAGQCLFQRQGGALHHGVEEVGFVFEVPIDGAARGTRRCGNVVERSA